MGLCVDFHQRFLNNIFSTLPISKKPEAIDEEAWSIRLVEPLKGPGIVPIDSL